MCWHVWSILVISYNISQNQALRFIVIKKWLLKKAQLSFSLCRFTHCCLVTPLSHTQVLPAIEVLSTMYISPHPKLLLHWMNYENTMSTTKFVSIIPVKAPRRCQFFPCNTETRVLFSLSQITYWHRLPCISFPTLVHRKHLDICSLFIRKLIQVKLNRHCNFINPGWWFAPFTTRGAAVEEGIFAMNIMKKSTHAVINKIRPLIFSYVFVSINYMNAFWYWWDWGSVYDFFVTIKEIRSQNLSI